VPIANQWKSQNIRTLKENFRPQINTPELQTRTRKTGQAAKATFQHGFETPRRTLEESRGRLYDLGI
jgi:hypothetical protein